MSPADGSRATKPRGNHGYQMIPLVLRALGSLTSSLESLQWIELFARAKGAGWDGTIEHILLCGRKGEEVGSEIHHTPTVFL